MTRGVRPEHVRLGEPPDGAPRRAGSVAAVEYLGADTIVSLSTDSGDRLSARLPGASPLRPGDPVSAWWDEKDESRFDAEGRRLN